MRSFFVTLLLCFSLPHLYAQDFTVNINYVTTDGSHDPSLIFYDGKRRLNWDDFKGLPDASSEASALTSAGFGYNMGFGTSKGKSTLFISVYCSFNKNQSWVKPIGHNDYILNHEQHHFDIAYICTMHFVKKLQEAKLTPANYKKILDETYSGSIKEMNDTQTQYDDETQHGILKDNQAQWAEKVDNELKTLNTTEQ